MNFRLRPISRRKETKPKGKRKNIKFLTKSKINKKMGSLVESPICGEVKL